ncbi:toll/interleukin-1 receptor domain-containing protein [Parafrankia sp. BMG5.11]|uniref:tetratricopeptide repeat protein n=1 Tax=Parafrankia sp. BMG5.11 TaxID=222540 RepID=UPI00103A56C0|nr:toll/interleukin-1 receptor domain-containing protein [Parafrankia sp. BMG5.11]TCJ40421.1 toll/interleukin-1 receptor domain-containing protein [Parafrankia sp. BMG5.11]
MSNGGNTESTTGDSRAGWDFFVSYTAADRPWAEWISWQLEEAGYRVLVQAWDFVAGTNWQIRMQQGVQRAQRTVAVLSDAYLTSVYGQTEWQAAHAADPHGFGRKLLPVRVEDCLRPGLLGAVVSIDLFNHDAHQAGRYLLDHVRHALTGRAKPTSPPGFPVHRPNAPTREPAFPTTDPEPADTTLAPDDRQSLEDLLAQQRRTLGHDATRTLATAHLLGLALVNLGNHTAARALLDDTLTRRRATLGHDHTDTLRTAHLLGWTLDRLGDHTAARTLLDDTLTRRRATLGHNHPSTLATAKLLGWTLGNLGDHTAARALLDDTLTRRRATLGHDHPSTLETAHRLGWTLDKLGDHTAARTLLDDTLTRQRHTLGHDHASALATAKLLEWTLDKRGKRHSRRQRSTRWQRAPDAG